MARRQEFTQWSVEATYGCGVSEDGQRPRGTTRVWAVVALGSVVVLVCAGAGPVAAGPGAHEGHSDARRVTRWPSLRSRSRRPCRPTAGCRAGARPVAVTATGAYDGDHQFLVPGREQGGVPALYVVTPLVARRPRACWWHEVGSRLIRHSRNRSRPRRRRAG